MLDVDYNAWEGVLLVVEHNATACKVALSKLSDAPNTAGKCLMGESQSACKDFAYLFCKAVIRHSHVTHKLVWLFTSVVSSMQLLRRYWYECT